MHECTLTGQQRLEGGRPWSGVRGSGCAGAPAPRPASVRAGRWPASRPFHASGGPSNFLLTAFSTNFMHKNQSLSTPRHHQRSFSVANMLRQRAFASGCRASDGQRVVVSPVGAGTAARGLPSPVARVQQLQQLWRWACDPPIGPESCQEIASRNNSALAPAGPRKAPRHGRARRSSPAPRRQRTRRLRRPPPLPAPPGMRTWI
jgi:hypothetical protein